MAPVAVPSANRELLGIASNNILSALDTRFLHTPPTPTSSSLSSSFGLTTRALSSLVRRQTVVPISATYAGLNAGPPPGNVAGIVLGAVAATLLVMWLLYTCFNIGGEPPRSSVDEIGVETLERRTRTRTTRSAPSRRRSRSRSEVIEVRSAPRPRREHQRVRETIVLEESRRSAPPPPDDEDDIVEVIEEHSPPPPRRQSSRRVSSSGGYRNVDPDEFAGGDRPMRKVRR